jgi:hypothetical protein
MASMNSIDTIRVLNRIARTHYHDGVVTYDHEAYLRECFACLHGFFATELYVTQDKSMPESPLENAYLFSALTYKREGNDQIGLVKLTASDADLGYYFYEEVKEELSAKFNPIIGELYNDIRDKRSMSVTEALLKDKRKGKDLFLFSDKPYNEPVDPGDPMKRPVDARISFFCTSDLEFSAGDSRDRFKARNVEQIEKFRIVLTDDDGADPGVTNEQVGNLLWHYRKLQETYLADHDGQEFVVHFIRPSFIEFGYNLLLSLGTNCRLEADQLAFIYLIVHKIVSQTVIERTKETKKIELLKNISISTHSIKTGINGLLSPPLNSLEQSKALHNDPWIQEALKARDRVLAFTGFINLMSKLSSKDLNRKEIRDTLIRSGLFCVTQKSYPLSERLKEILDLQQRDKNRMKVITPGNINIEIDETYFAYDDLSPAEPFYELLLLTVVENCIKHGVKNIKTGKITLDMIYNQTEKLIGFSNLASEKFMLNYSNSTGNINMFFILFEKLNLGNFECYSDGKFFMNIRSN